MMAKMFLLHQVLLETHVKKFSKVSEFRSSRSLEYNFFVDLRYSMATNYFISSSVKVFKYNINLWSIQH